jgi:hypothetical protein
MNVAHWCLFLSVSNLDDIIAGYSKLLLAGRIQPFLYLSITFEAAIKKNSYFPKVHWILK